MNHKHPIDCQGITAASFRSHPASLRTFSQLIAICLTCTLLVKPCLAEEKKASKSQQRLSSTVEYLSADEREGRGVGTKGLDMAAEFIAKEFSRLGLKTELYKGQPFQEFSLVTNSELGKAAENHLQFNSASEKKSSVTLALGKQFTPLAIGGSAKFDAPMIFAGYGITAPKLKYDDYEGLDVKGKVVVILRKEPQQQNPHSLFDGTKPSRHALFVTKVSNAFQHGAAAVVMINDQAELSRSQTSRLQAWNKAVEKLVEIHQAYSKLEETDDKQQAKYQQDIQAQAKAIDNMGTKPRIRAAEATTPMIQVVSSSCGPPNHRAVGDRRNGECPSASA